MSTGTITPYRSGQRPRRDDFPHLLRAEWTKFRTVRLQREPERGS